jgi:sec-independent protein translocase protein TatA
MSEWIIVAVVGVVLLFSAKKLPDMARGLGQSMRIFKAETRGLKEDDARSEPKPVEPARSEAPAPSPAPAPTRKTVPDEPRRSE